MSEEDELEIKVEDNKNKDILYSVKVTNRIFIGIMNLTECVQVICTRADQIDGGGKIFIAANSGGSSYELATQEIIQGKCPLSIIRSRGIIGNTEYVEKWSVNELEKSEALIDKIESVFDRSDKYNIKKKLIELRDN